MNTKLASFLFLLSLSFCFTANAQYMNREGAINLPSNSFNQQLASGMYEGAVGQSLHPETTYPIYMIVTKRSAGVQQLQISSSIHHDDKLYFRKIYNNTLQPWVELATRGKNTFIGDQRINGTLSVKEVRVETTGADFVFEDDYELPTLDEVASHIQEKKHLPGIASAKEMQEDGVGLAELNVKLLQKIEELTLYTLQQHTLIKDMNEQMDQMKSQISSLELQIKK